MGQDGTPEGEGPVVIAACAVAAAAVFWTAWLMTGSVLAGCGAAWGVGTLAVLGLIAATVEWDSRTDPDDG